MRKRLVEMPKIKSWSRMMAMGCDTRRFPSFVGLRGNGEFFFFFSGYALVVRSVTERVIG
jgi:hypothetical protein